jgi:hypothetical protein
MHPREKSSAPAGNGNGVSGQQPDINIDPGIKFILV